MRRPIALVTRSLELLTTASSLDIVAQTILKSGNESETGTDRE